MTAQTTTVTCPCGGHSLTLAPDKPPVGGRAAFTCPACGERRTFVRTPDGAVFEPARPLPEKPFSPAASPARSSPPPTPVPPGVAVAIVAVVDPVWLEALAAALPAPEWFVLPAGPDPEQSVADLRAQAPRLVLLSADRPDTPVLLAEIAGWSGRRRERLALVLLGAFADNDPVAAFAASADAVLDIGKTEDAAGRIQAVLDRIADRPSLFGGS